MTRTLIHNAIIVNEGRQFKGAVLIEGDRIAAIYEGEAPIANPALSSLNCTDAKEALLLPGIIDTHVHFREPGITHKADIAHESRAALAGGVTSVIDMPNVSPPTTSLGRWQERMVLGEHESRTNYAYYIGATNEWTMDDEQLPSCPIIKLFMGSSTGNMLVDDREALLRIFRYAAKRNILIVAHCEDTSRINERMTKAKQRWGDDPAVEHHPWIRDEEACFRSSSLAVNLAKKTGARLHIAHISTERELSSLFSPLTTHLPQITGEACVPHLLFCDDDYGRLGTRIKCNPAIKSRKDRNALRQAVADERIRTIATDHAPHLLQEKEGGCVRAASGIPMIQFSLVSMLELVDEGVLSLNRLVDAMCHYPAQVFGIKERGFLRLGNKADITLVKHEEWTLQKEDILSKCGWSPLEGHTFKWRVQKTFVNGNLAYDNGHINDNIRGEALTFDFN